MTDDIEQRLRALSDRLPSPDKEVTATAREAMRQAMEDVSPSPRRLPRLRGVRRRSFLLAGAALLVAVGTALAADRWTAADLPSFGDGPREAFVLPTTDILPGGYERTRPPAYAELPERPSLRFPKGVTHTEAVRRYTLARRRSEVVPPRAELADPLPAGKVVLIEDDTVAIDPAAPTGYSPKTGLVLQPPSPAFVGSGVRVGARPLARCQLLIGRADPNSPDCDAAGERTYVREGVAGRWISSPNEERYDLGLVGASTELAVLDRPARPTDRIPRRFIFSTPGRPRPDYANARRALANDQVEVFVVPVGSDDVCLVVKERSGVGFGCGAREHLASLGGMWHTSGGPRSARLTALVGDGVEVARVAGGKEVRVHDNVFSIELPEGVDRLTLSGPIGEYELELFPAGLPPDQPQRPDRSREREVVGIELAAGKRASISVAPNRGGGRCQWVRVAGTVRSFGCAQPDDPALPYDVVTSSFYPAGRGDPLVYAGELAPEVAGVEMRFADDEVVRLPIAEGLVLYEVAPDRLRADRWPVSVTTFDRAGVPLVRDHLPGFPQIARQHTGP